MILGSSNSNTPVLLAYIVMVSFDLKVTLLIGSRPHSYFMMVPAQNSIPLESCCCLNIR